jgi:hypothetical protein
MSNQQSITESDKIADMISKLIRDKANSVGYNGGGMELPIESIDDIKIKVDLYWLFEGENGANTIECLIRPQPYFEYELVTLADHEVVGDFTIEICIRNIIYLLGNLRFDKMNGIFTTTPQLAHRENVMNIQEKLAEYFKTFDKIQTSIKKCCVCFDTTNSKTPCGHTLCISCYMKIQGNGKHSVSDNWDYTFHKNCPYCRENIKTMVPSCSSINISLRNLNQ